MPGGIEFMKEVGSRFQLDYRIAIPRELVALSQVDFDDETYLHEKPSVHLVFEFNQQKMRYEYKYMI